MAFHPVRVFPLFSRLIWHAAVCWVSLCYLSVLAPVAVYAHEAMPKAVAHGLSVATNTALRDTLLVTSKSVLVALPNGPELVTHLDLQQEFGARDLADVLGTLAGLQLRRFGGSGAGAVPSMRGSGPAQVRILVDGLALADAESGMLDLTHLPWQRFSRADVYRGFVPARLGGAPGVGAINLVTDRGRTGWDVRSGMGSFGDRSGQLSWGTQNQDSDFMLMAHGRRIDNDYTYTDHLQTFTRTADDTLAVRRNAQWQEWGLWSQGGWHRGDWAWRGTWGSYDRQGGRPGAMGVPTTEATVKLASQDGRLSCRWRDGLLAVDIAGRREEEFLYDDRGEVVSGFAGTVHSLTRDLTLRLVTAPVFLNHPRDVVSNLSAVAGVQWRHQDFQQNYNDLLNPIRTRKTWTLFAEGHFGFAGNRWQLVPGWRWRRSLDDFPPLPAFYYLDTESGAPHVSRDQSPSVALTGELIPGELFLRWEYAHAVRQPTWIELFGHRGGLAGNRELEPEESTSLAGDLTWQPMFWPLTLRVGLFQTTGEQTIVYVQNSPGTSKPTNAGASETRGVELEATLEISSLALTTNATWQHARDKSGIQPYDGKDLPYLPGAEVWIRAARSSGAWRPYLTVAWQDGNYRDRANTLAGRAASRTLVGAGLSWHWLWPGGTHTLELTAGVINLTNNDVYDVEGFPLPGRSWRTAMDVRF